MPPLTFARKAYLGIALPLALFALWQWILVETTRGDGTFSGMLLFLAQAALLPAVAVANAWTLPLAWRSPPALVAAGCALPAAVGAVEVALVHGTGSFRAWLEGFISGGGGWLAVALLYAPLAAALVHRLRRGSHPPGAAPP